MYTIYVDNKLHGGKIMTDKEKMIEITKGAFIKYQIVYKSDLSSANDIEFAFNKYYFFMRMLEGVYPDLNRKELESEWNKEIEND